MCSVKLDNGLQCVEHNIKQLLDTAKCMNVMKYISKLDIHVDSINT